MPKFDLKYLLLRFKIKELNIWETLENLVNLEIKLDNVVYGKIVDVGVTSGEFDIQALVKVSNSDIARYLPDVIQTAIPENIRKGIEFSNNVFWYSSK